MGNYGYAYSVDGYHNADSQCVPDIPTHRRPAIYINSTTTFAQIPDGTSNTIVFSEMVPGPATTATDPAADPAGCGPRTCFAASAGCSRPTRARAINV